MLSNKPYVSCFALCLLSVILSSCATTRSNSQSTRTAEAVSAPAVNYADRLPAKIHTGGVKTVLVDPNVHAWGAYDADGNLVRAGIAVAGADWCPDIGRRCHTSSGTFRIVSLGAASCKSTLYPRPNGGAPMPYCMFFNKNQGLHGSYQLAEANLSHGCVRMAVPDAEWMRFNFATIGTKVIIKPY